MVQDPKVLLEMDDSGQIATLWLNRPEKMNALNWAIFSQLADHLDELSFNKKVRVILVKSKAIVFSAGIDLKFLAGQDPTAPKFDFAGPPFRYGMRTTLQNIFTKIATLEIPVIAVIDGICFGSGFELALACDFRYATTTSTFQMKESHLGIIPDLGGSIRLSRLVNISHSKEICLAGRLVNAIEGYRMGFLNGVTNTSEELDNDVNSLVNSLLCAAPLAVGMGKRMIDALYTESIADGLDREAMVNSVLINTKDFKIGVASFFDKEDPKWRGK